MVLMPTSMVTAASMTTSGNGVDGNGVDGDVDGDASDAEDVKQKYFFLTSDMFKFLAKSQFFENGKI